MNNALSLKLVAAVLAVVMWSGAANAVPVTCAKSSDDAYMLLSSSHAANIQCWDWGTQPNPGHNIEVGAGIGGDAILQLPADMELIAKSGGDNSSFFTVLSGSLTSGLSGSFSVGTTGDLALLFKSGRGNNTPSWWLYSITNLTAGEVFSWSIRGAPPINGLSHVEAYSVPEPGTLALIGLGLVGLGITGRRKLN